MIQVFFFVTNTIIEKLKKLCHSKNIDIAILLLKRYHKFLDIFSKKKVDTLPIYCLYNYAIIIKNGYQIFISYYL